MYNHAVILFPDNNFKVWKWQIDLYTDHTSPGYYDQKHMYMYEAVKY